MVQLRSRDSHRANGLKPRSFAQPSVIYYVKLGSRIILYIYIYTLRYIMCLYICTHMCIYIYIYVCVCVFIYFIYTYSIEMQSPRHSFEKAEISAKELGPGLGRSSLHPGWR